MGADEFHPHLYITGNPAPGGSIRFKAIGDPYALNRSVFLGISLNPEVLNPPVPLPPYGNLLIDWPFVLIPLGTLSPEGVVVSTPFQFPPSFPAAPSTFPLQALIGDLLSNLHVVQVYGARTKSAE